MKRKDKQKKVSGTKYDGGKSPLSLLPKEAVFSIADVMGYGANKYGAHNFKGGLEFTRLASAALRHIYTWLSGVDRDSESNLNHIAHAGANLMMLLYMIEHRPDLDDRGKSDE